MAGRKITDEREAEACLSAAAASGLDRAAWANRQGIDARSLNAWRLNLERRERGSGAVPPLRVLELVPAPDEPPRSTYQVRCGSFVVEVDDHFDERVLSRLLAVVAAC